MKALNRLEHVIAREKMSFMNWWKEETNLQEIKAPSKIPQKGQDRGQRN